MEEVAQPRIVELGFKATIGLFTGIAFSLALGRTYIRIVQTRTVTLDDAFFFLAVITLIAGTITLYITIPYLYVQKNVDPDSTVITPEFIALLQRCMRLQLATNMLLSVTLFAVKFSFLFFFRDLVRRLRGLMMWWWCVLVAVVASGVVSVLAVFASCPYFDETVLLKCFTSARRSDQNGIFNGWVFLDILTDGLLITIPIAILWRVRIGLRRKLCLGAILCLSVFTMAVSAVRIAGASLPSGFIDDIWINFWLHVEAAVAVVVVSSSTYRSLYVQHEREKRVGRVTADNSHPRRRLVLWRRRERERQGAMLRPSLKAPDPVLGV